MRLLSIATAIIASLIFSAPAAAQDRIDVVASFSGGGVTTLDDARG